MAWMEGFGWVKNLSTGKTYYADNSREDVNGKPLLVSDDGETSGEALEKSISGIRKRINNLKKDIEK